ncbi:hypothetical protein N9B47_00315 [bacterium]|nr:hypothetical protein [bacterium]
MAQNYLSFCFFRLNTPKPVSNLYQKVGLLTCTTGKEYYGFGMETETMDLIEKFKAIDTAMDELAKKVEAQCRVHISDLEKSMAAHSLFLEDRFTSKPTVILQKS